MHQAGDDAEWGWDLYDKESGGRKMTTAAAWKINNVKYLDFTHI
jgi:hypothetical protein